MHLLQVEVCTWSFTSVSRCVAIAIGLAACLFSPSIAWSQQPVLLIHPTLVLLEGNDRSATINVTNRGDGDGIFEISWVDFAMTREGGLLRSDGLADWSIQPYVRYSPRRISLAPGETQLVKIALRRQNELAEGEYYSHFRVLTVNPNEAEFSEDGEDTETQTSVRVAARTAMAIPIIWRNSAEEPAADIESAELNTDTGQLQVAVKRKGMVSVRGYLHVLGTTDDGIETELADPTHFVIYANLDVRTVKIDLKPNVTAPPGIQIVYTTDIDGSLQQGALASYLINN